MFTIRKRKISYDLRALVAIGFLTGAQIPTAFAEPVTCNRLTVGQSVVIQYERNQSPTGVPAGYKLTRKGELEYLIEINLAFENTLAVEHWKQYVSGCLESFSTLIQSKRPAVSFRLSTAEDVPIHKVSIGGEEEIRSNSKKYDRNIKCSAVVHEVMHLLGLPDEYLEKTRDLEIGQLVPDPIYSCRAIGPPDSLMGDDSEAVSIGSAPPADNEVKYRVERCDCPIEVDCSALAATSDGKTCPAGAQRGEMFQFAASANSGIEIVPVVTSRFFVLRNGKHERVRGSQPRPVEEPKVLKGTALYPAHLRVLTEPGCTDVNRCYYACAQNAHLPGDREAAASLSSKCKPVPKDCLSGYFRCWD